MFLLDTCALLWPAQGGYRFTPSVLKKIELSQAVYLSSISGFEISLKCRKGKPELPVSPEKWFNTVLSHHDITVVPADLDICIAANNLPFFHNDPCDRLIIATAQILNTPIVTADEKFSSYEVEIIF